jgi:phospholipid/cholesterol/gamma-HCH transport system permease protein
VRIAGAEQTVSGEPALEGVIQGERLALAASGTWTADYADSLERMVEAESSKPARSVALDLAKVERLDTFGAWLMERLLRSFSARGCETSLVGVAENYRDLIGELQQVGRAPAPAPTRRPALVNVLEDIGRTVAAVVDDSLRLLQMVGAIATAFGRVIVRPANFRLTSMVHHLDQTGWRAVPIILLITFLIGCIIAQQGLFHFRRFGADIFVVDMVGILVLREIGVLIVCVMVAGRSGSAYTAELGSMKMREEVDALRTMGFDPIEVLVLPRILALIVSVPLLTFLGSMAALYGGGLVCWVYGGIQPEVFLSRLREAISLDHFVVGIIKAPFMAMVIGTVACMEGMQVKGSAESLGMQTTASVVKAIFLVIVLDGFFAIFFAAIGK